MLLNAIIRPTIKVRLFLSLISIVLFTGTAFIIIGVWIINKNILSQAYDAIQGHLNTARYIYHQQTNDISTFLNLAASRSLIKEALLNKDRDQLIDELEKINRIIGLDYLNVTDEKGVVIARANNKDVYGDNAGFEPCVRHVLENHGPCFGTDILSSDLLLLEGESLAERALIKVQSAATDQRIPDFEDRGLSIIAASPIFEDDRFAGLVFGGRLLNNNFEFVDNIKNLVFRDEKINDVEVGSATLFMEGLRISTNVKRKDGTRAIGTRVSEKVYEKVVHQQKIWVDKAFVVNKWFISGYVPINNIKDEVVGILYVGMLEEKYDQIRRNTTMLFLIMTIIGAVIAVLLSFSLIKRIIYPLNSFISASKEIADGNYSRKIHMESKDEMGILASSFNKMIDAIFERDQILKESTQSQIAQSEKLASLGRLASGIAHEVNNPLTGILTYSSMLSEELRDTQYKEDLDIIVKETLRCRSIVRGILDFARETRLERSLVNICDVINDTLKILENHISFHNIRVIRNFHESIPDISVDENQIKSVINNLCLNAADAMPEGGDLKISVHYDDNLNYVIIEISDTGKGISEENLSKVFDPFFTTKAPGEGTGLGLSVSHGIINSHEGTIDVRSHVGKGATFTIKLPA
ncbi:MAG: cache domain-containing protein [Deltaproteobacteria bacterium]|nr:cache domain-containing protein [Deltaproteobacteria bacterium]